MIRATRATGVLAMVLSSVLVACTSDGDGFGGAGGTAGAGGTSQPCVPDAQVSCSCADSGHGTQLCKADGSGYGACQGCSGGQGGQGGQGGTHTSTTGTTSIDTTTTDTTTTTTTTSSTCAGADGAELDLQLVTLYANPPDLADWPATTTITELDFTNDGVHSVFSKQDGADRWPDVIPPGWDGPLQYTLGMVECIDGQWYGSAVIEFWYGLAASGGNVAVDNQIAANWYYDAIRWGLLAGRQPVTGETIGLFVAAGNLRNITTDDPLQSPVTERSNVVLVPMSVSESFPETPAALASVASAEGARRAVGIVWTCLVALDEPSSRPHAAHRSRFPRRAHTFAARFA